MTLKEAEKHLLFKVITGSRAYGLDTPESDTDIKGVFLLPNDYLLVGDYIPQISNETNDITYYELNRFMELLNANNPNIIEVLFSDQQDILFVDPRFEIVLKNKELFLTKNLKNTFGRYAISQISKARGLNKKIVNPISEVKKSILDFCHIFDKETGYMMTATQWLIKKNYKQENIGLAKTPNGVELYKVYYSDDDNFFRGIMNDNSQDVRHSEVPKGYPLEGFLVYNKDGYKCYCDEYREYWEWIKKRNPVRYNDNIKNGGNYDCYLDTETEYLTERGWLKSIEIDDKTKLATIDSNYSLIYQEPTEKIIKKYSGQIITYEDRYTKFSVTPNHNLFLSKFYRNQNKNSRIYDDEKSSWEFITAEKYYKQKGESHYISHIKQNSKQYENIPDDWWFLCGVYLGDGCVKRTNNEIKEIRISQLESKPLFYELDKMGINRYKSRITKGGQNWTFIITNKSIVNFIIENFNVGCFNKDIPLNIATNITDTQFMLLYKGLILTDGTSNINGFETYYSYNKKLIDSIQIMCFCHGVYSQLYTYNEISDYTKKRVNKYYLSFPKNKYKTYRCLQKKNFTIKNVDDQIISCFTVPNHILITRNDNKITIQGNTKNMLHCNRLLDMAIEMAEGKGVILKRPNREWLLSVKKGKLKYDEIIKIINEKKGRLDDVYLKSSLPDQIDENLIKNIILKIRKS